MSTKKTNYYYKLFRVKRNDGRTTTVSMNPGLAARASRILGDPEVVKTFVKAAALEYVDGMPGAKNCSGYVSGKLNEVVEQRVRGASELLAA